MQWSGAGVWSLRSSRDPNQKAEYKQSIGMVFETEPVILRAFTKRVGRRMGKAVPSGIPHQRA
jgi:hypothetical protein